MGTRPVYPRTATEATGATMATEAITNATGGQIGLRPDDCRLSQSFQPKNKRHTDYPFLFCRMDE
jgi:hypothetical protein